MAQEPPKRFALLVGIDIYLEGERKDKNGNKFSISNLHGCTNDVSSMKGFLRDHFQPLDVRTLTSSPSPGSNKPLEPEDQWPTFNNIEKEFKHVYETSKKGDFFLFHFSGHGSRLEPIAQQPNRPETAAKEDASLILVDYCCEKPPLRGWQLNRWLEDLHVKGVIVLVILDSCFAGGSWRGKTKTRTPGDLSEVPILQSDEEAAKRSLVKRNDRNSSKEWSWSINPQYLTVLAACQADETAGETEYKQKYHGIFTSGLLSHFETNTQNVLLSRYYDICSEIANNVSGQRPQAYGRDTLHFYGTTEPFAVAPLPAKIEQLSDGSKDAIIPVGKIHGIRKDAEFEVYSETSSQVLRIYEVASLICRAKITTEEEARLKDAKNVVIPSRWSLGSDALEISVASSLGESFRETLHNSLAHRFVNKIEITTFDTAHSASPDKLSLAKREDGGIEFLGPESLIGYAGPARALCIKNDDSQRLATDAAVILSHLIRFGQILQLKEEAGQDEQPFDVSIVPVNQKMDAGPFQEGQKFKLTFRNNSKNDDLYLTVIFLGPGFCVQQLHPPEKSEAVQPGHKATIIFQTTIPKPLKGENQTGGLVHRDIIRAIVSEDTEVTWKRQGLPDIWEANQVDKNYPKNGLRDLTISSDVYIEWWVKDIVVSTRA